MNLSVIIPCYNEIKSIELEITAKIGRRKYRIYEVGIGYFGRTYVEGKEIGWKDGVWAI